MRSASRKPCEQGDGEEIRHSFRAALRLSISLAVAAAAVLLAAAAVEWHTVIAAPLGVVSIVVRVVGFWATQILLAPVGNVLPMMPGGARYRIAYDITRVLALLLPALTLHAGALLVLIGIAVLNLLFVLALRRVVLRFSTSPGPTHARQGIRRTLRGDATT